MKKKFNFNSLEIIIMKKCWYFSVAFSAKFFWFLKTIFKIISQSLSPSQQRKMSILKMFLHISTKNPCSLFLTTIWMFLWRWGNNIILSKNSSNFKTLYWFSNYCKNDEMAVIIYCKHPTSVVPYTVKTSISMYSDIYM